MFAQKLILGGPVSKDIGLLHPISMQVYYFTFIAQIFCFVVTTIAFMGW